MMFRRLLIDFWMMFGSVSSGFEWFQMARNQSGFDWFRVVSRHNIYVGLQQVVSSGFEGGVSSKLSGSNQWFRVVSSGFEGGVSSELSGSDFPTEQLVLFALHGFIVIP